MTRAKDDLHLILPKRFFTHQQASTGDRHVFASRSRFIPAAILDRFTCSAWPVAQHQNRSREMRAERITFSRKEFRAALISVLAAYADALRLLEHSALGHLSRRCFPGGLDSHAACGPYDCLFVSPGAASSQPRGRSVGGTMSSLMTWLRRARSCSSSTGRPTSSKSPNLRPRSRQAEA